MFCIRQLVETELQNVREVQELCTDFKKGYDAVRIVVLLGASAVLRKASTRFLFTVFMSVYKQ